MANYNRNEMKNTAEQWLKIAIERHQRHMDGKEPTTGKEGDMSQMLMMDEMKMAFKALVTGKPVEATDKYLSMNDKLGSGKSKM